MDLISILDVMLTKYIALIILQEHPKVKKNAKFVNITSKILNNFASSWDSVFVDLVCKYLGYIS